MFNLKNASIKTKLILIIFGIALASQLITFSFLSVERYNYLRKELIHQSQINAKLISEYLISPLIFEDMDGVKAILQKIDAIDFILSAAVYNAAGELIVSQKKKGEILIPQQEIHQSKYLRGMLHINEEIVHGGVYYGNIHLIVSTAQLKKNFISQLLMLFIIVVIMAIIIYLFASKMQRIISKPILDLAENAKNIALEGDYPLRLARSGNDEISQLYNSFNEMINKIAERSNERDKALVVVQDQYDRFLAILNSFPQIIYVVDPKSFKILFVNSTLENLYEDELVGKNCYEAFHNNPEMCSFCKINELKKLGDEVVWEHHNTNFDKYYLIMDKLIKWPDDRVVSMEVAIDITKRKESEIELIKHREHLEELVKERTVELKTQNAELERFNKLFIGREFRIKELREKVKKIQKEYGITAPLPKDYTE